MQAAADRLSPDIIRKRLNHWSLALGPKNSLAEAGRLSDSVKVYEAILDRSKEATRFDQCTAFQSVNLAALSANAAFEMRIRELRLYCSDIEHRNKAAELIRKGLVEHAIQELRLQIKANPKYEEAFVMLAGLNRQTGRNRKPLKRCGIMSKKSKTQ